MELVSTLYTSNFRDIPASLRQIAQRIEDNEIDATSVAVVILVEDEAEPIQVHGLGKGDMDRTYFLLGLGQYWIAWTGMEGE